MRKIYLETRRDKFRKSAIYPYLQLMRFDRPIGTLLLLWPTLWALWIASKGVPEPKILAIFLLGTILMRAAGCVINDWADRDFDAHVKRTKNRPLATGAISSKHALLLFVGLGLLAFALVLFLNMATVKLSLIGLVLAISYPFAKRFTHFPQVVLGLAFSWGIPMAFMAVRTNIPPAAWLLLLANLLWTVAYDTQYAMVDRKDDLKIGVKSTAVLFGDADRLIIGLLQAMVVLALLLAGARESLRPEYTLSLIPALGLFLYQQWLTWNRKEARCFRAFLNNNWVGAVIFAGVIFSFY